MANEKTGNFNTENLIEFFILVALFVLLLTPRLFYLSQLPDLTLTWYYQSYYHVGMAKMWIKHGWRPELDLSYGGVPYTYPPLYHICLAFFSLVFKVPVEIVSRYFAPSVGALSCVTFYFLFKQFLESKESAFLAVSYLCFTYSFMNETYYMAPVTIGITLLPLGLISVKNSLEKAGKNLILLFLINAILVFLNAFIEVIFVLTLIPLVIFYWNNENGLKTVKWLLLSTIPALLYFAPLFLKYGPANSMISEMGKYPSIQDFVNHYSEPFIILSVFGLVTLFLERKKKKKLTSLIYTWTCILLFFSTYNPVKPLEWWRYVPFLAVPLAFSIGYGVKYLTERLGNKYLKTLSLITLFIIGFYSMYPSSIRSTNPKYRVLLNPDEIKALEWISQNTEENSTFLADHVFSEAVIGRAARVVMYGGCWEMCRDYAQRCWDAERIIFLKNPLQAYNLMKKYNVTYVVISDRIINGVYWVVSPYSFKATDPYSYFDGPNKFENTTYWFKVYSYGSVKIYKIRP